MTIPNLISAHQKRVTATRLQKAISVINQAYKMAYDDVGEASPEEAKALGGEAYFKKYWAPYIKVQTYCKTSEDCGYKHNEKILDFNGTGRASTHSDSQNIAFYTMDGLWFYIFTAYFSWNDKEEHEFRSVGTAIFVDINGSRKPNKFGKDVFFLDRKLDGKGIQPYGYNFTNEFIDKQCSLSGDGATCAEKIRRAGWQIDKSYPWNI